MDDPFGPTPPQNSSPFGRSRQSTEPQIWAERAKTLFDNHPKYRAEKPSSNYNAILMQIIHEESDGASRRYMLKAAYPEVAGIVRNEGNYLDIFQYAKHIVNLITLVDDPMKRKEVEGSEEVAGWTHPYLVMECLENGTLADFQRRLTVFEQGLPNGRRFPLPNRFLWSIFICLIRACVGMAWPPPGPNVELEVPRRNDPSMVTHSDMHGGNFMFGNIDPQEAEHSQVPILKLIDFGEAQTMSAPRKEPPLDNFSMNKFDKPLGLDNSRAASGRRNVAIDKNLLDVGCVMSRLIAGRVFSFVPTCRDISQDPTVHRSLDPDLRLLIQRCLAVDPRNRPRLEELIPSLAANIKTEDDYKNLPGYDGMESDKTLLLVTSKFLLNADT